MLQYMKHKEHGTHIAYNQDEVERNEPNGWVCVDHPHDDPFSEPRDRNTALELSDKPLPELREIAREMGLNVHHAARENRIIQMIMGIE